MDDKLFDARWPLRIADQGCFFVGGDYTETAAGRLSSGHMYVQYQIPAEQKHPYPVVMIHGGGQTGVNFLGTPDGRRGWADFFVANGYAVYVVDQPSRGRASAIVQPMGPLCECVRSMAGPIRSSRALPAARIISSTVPMSFMLSTWER